MIPVYQTIFGDGSQGGEAGNCFSACIASLLELSISEVPNFCGKYTPLDSQDRRWLTDTQEWLRPRGLFLLDIGEAPNLGSEAAQRFRDSVGYHIINAYWTPGLLHSVVGLRGRIIHNPHPGGPLSLPDNDWIYSFLIPLDPAAYVCLGAEDAA